MRQVDNLILNCQILLCVQRNEYRDIVQLETRLFNLLQQDIACIEISTLQDLTNLYLSYDYHRGMTLVINLASIFIKKVPIFTLFMFDT